MEENIEKAKAAKQKIEASWLGIEGVVGIGIGLTSSGQVGIIVSTRDDPAQLQDRIPSQVEGVPVELQRSGEIRALS